MNYDFSENKIFMSIDELSRFAYPISNGEILAEKYGFTKKIMTSNEDPFFRAIGTQDEKVSKAISGIAESYTNFLSATHTEIELSYSFFADNIEVLLNGLSDIISYDGIYHTVEVIKPIKRNQIVRDPFVYPEFFARAVIIAYLYAKEIGVSEIKIGLSFLTKTSGDLISYTALFPTQVLERLFQTLIHRAEPFLLTEYENKALFSTETKDLSFPYPTIRDGQAVFIREAYKAIKKRENLLVSAPTGIGKTMSALFPAVLSVAHDNADKIFYLTAKTITGNAALDAARRIAVSSHYFRACAVLSKEMTCPLKKKFAFGFSSSCSCCEFLNASRLSYEERQHNALTELLRSDDTIYSADRIKEVAFAHEVCPYELSLDLSEYCHLVVCDYNYVIDDNVRFRRYFKRENNHERYVFLFDEAHNLPDRTRNTYSVAITVAQARELYEKIMMYFSDNGKLVDASVSYLSVLEELYKNATDNGYTKFVDGVEQFCGYFEDNALPENFALRVTSLTKLLSSALRDAEHSEEMSPYYSSLYKLSFISSYFDDKFRIYCEREGESLKVELLCIDPSGILGQMLSVASSTILFSATLSPLDYFEDVLGIKNANKDELESPYDSENLCLITYDSISTRYSDRQATEQDIAEVISAIIAEKEGNYLVYFPSYEYMKRVCKVFARMAPDCGIVMQKPGMSFKERKRFIEIFHERKTSSIIGFCVLGGMFSEGIDLAGESLIGAIIIGCGIPQISAERNIMSNYYNQKNERGHEFAYICPGMNKILQAGGRVIRSENDKGVVVLIDDRLNDPNLCSLFPQHWQHMKYTGNLTSLHVILSDFWKKN